MHFRSTAVLTLLMLLNGACDSSEGHKATASAPTVPDGMAVFRKNCVVCHGANGNLGLNGAKDLSQSTLTAAERTAIVTNGKNLMTPFGKILNPAEIDAVVQYTLSFSEKSAPQ